MKTSVIIPWDADVIHANLVVPSRWEGMPYLLLEAVARGQAVIASDCLGNRDVLKDYAAARLFKVEDVDGLASLMVGAAQ